MPDRARRLAAIATATCLGCSSVAISADLDIADELALEQSLRFASSFSSSSEGEAWLADMSRRLDVMVQDPFYRFEILRLVHEAAIAEGLDPQLVLALIEIESRFDRFAISVSGARGLMQVMPFWIKEIGHPRDNLFHPVTNLRYGCQILKHYLRITKNNVPAALARYNGGGDPQYASKVMAALNKRWSSPAGAALADARD